MTTKFTTAEIERILSVKVHLRQVFTMKGTEYESMFNYYTNSDQLKHFFVTGGCIASILQDEIPKDYDIYCSNYPAMSFLNNHLSGYPDLIRDVDPQYKDCIGKDGKMITANAITLKNRMSFITMMSGTVDEIRRSFDYVHCMPYYDIVNNTLHISRSQYDACVNKVLVVNNPASVKRYREEKFKERGYIKMELNNA